MKKPTRFNDLRNKKIGRLFVLDKPQIYINNRMYWICQCDCGSDPKPIPANNLNKKKKPTLSCGCLAREVTSKRSIKHGMTNHPLFEIYRGMIKRCYNTKSKRYKDYGGRGIKVCDEWLNDGDDYSGLMRFIEFITNKHKNYVELLSMKYSLNRTNNDGNYCPENCELASPTDQANNTRGNHIETVFGVTDTLANLARRFAPNIKMSTINQRLHRGMSLEDALTKKKYRDNYPVNVFGEVLSIKDAISKYAVVPARVVYTRIRKLDWGVEKSLITPISEVKKS